MFYPGALLASFGRVVPRSPSRPRRPSPRWWAVRRHSMGGSVDQNDKDNDDDSFNAGMPAADTESLESLIAKMSDFVQRCAPADEAKALNEQLWSMQMQVKLLAANAGGSGAHGSCDYLGADITSYEEGKKWCVEKGVERARVAMDADEPLSKVGRGGKE